MSEQSVVEIAEDRMNRAFAGKLVPELVGKPVYTYADLMRLGKPIEGRVDEPDADAEVRDELWTSPDLHPGFYRPANAPIKPSTSPEGAVPRCPTCNRPTTTTSVRRCAECGKGRSDA